MGPLITRLTPAVPNNGTRQRGRGAAGMDAGRERIPDKKVGGREWCPRGVVGGFDNAERAADTLYRLRQMGFRIALDDFGTGYSSLYNIRKFALDCQKICFAGNMQKRDFSILKNISQI